MPQTTMILKNARIYTMDGRIAEAAAITGDRIAKVGSNQEIKSWEGKLTQVIDLGGRTVVPGFNDSHTHLVGYGNSLRYANLENCLSCEEMCGRIRHFIRDRKIPEGEWVFGRGWNQNLFPGGIFPTKKDLDRVSDKHPILIIRTCGHVGIANTMALKDGNVTEETYLPGGQFDKGADGEPNGVIREAALEWFKKQRDPESARRELKQAIIRGGEEMLRYGITTVHTEDTYDLGYPGDFMDIYHAYQELASEKKLPLRIYQKISLPTGKDIDEFLSHCSLRTGMGHDFYRIGPVKQWADGTMGARTAGMKEPYSDAPGETGIYYYTDQELYDNIRKAHCAGMQVCIHTIGDGALEQVLNAYERVLRDFPRKNHRHRLVHGQVGNLELYKKIAKLGLNINIQPASTSTDIPIMESRLGSRAKYCHAWRTLTDLGVNLNASSDVPVETPNVFCGIYAIVTRKSLEHPELAPWNPHEKVTVMEALRFYTINSAYAAFEEHIKGSVTEGKLADLVILDRDPCAVDPEELPEVQVDATILGGKIVYLRNEKTLPSPV